MASLRAVAALLWGSGLCALLYQTAWQRMFRLSFGASTAASAAVLAIFLGGLGIGGLALGRRAQEDERPLFFYGTLELTVAAWACVSPFLAELLGKVYLGLGGVGVMGQTLATTIRLLIAAIVIGPAAFAMGGTLPAAARAVELDGDRARSRLALLYGMNTLGAVAGALVGTFFLFEVFGTRMSLWTAVLVNVLVGTVARALGREHVVERDPPPASATQGDAPRSGTLVASITAGLVGFAFLLLEVVWYRLLAPILGGSTYTFGLVLAAALAGIGLGGYLYSLRDPSRPVTLSHLAVVTALEGVCVALPIALGDRIAIYAIMTRPMAGLGFPALVVAWTSITAVVVFPAALVSGYQFPLLFALLGSGRERVARHVSLVYAFNTAGALLGSLLGGFVLIPRLSVVGCYRLVAAVLLGLSVLALVWGWTTSKRAAVAPSVVALLLVALGGVLSAQVGPTAVFRHLPIGAGRVALPGRTINELRLWTDEQNDSVLWQADGVETSVALTTGDQLGFVVDGKSDGAMYSDRATQVGLGLIPALVHPAPRRSLVIGLGTGMTAGALAATPGMERVDVAELEESILHVARVAAKANQDVLSRSNVTVHLGDGRELVLSAKASYDVIASEPSNPYRAGIAAFFTREFYQAVASHLRQDGVFVQWVPGYESDVRTLQIILGTLSSVLPNVEAWVTEDGDLAFIASRDHRVLDADALRRRIETEPFRSLLPRALLVQDLEGLLARFLASDAFLSKITAEAAAPISTDDRNLTEYAYARGVGNEHGGITQGLLTAAAKAHQDRPDVVGRVDWERVQELRPRAWHVDGTRVPPLSMPSRGARARASAVAAACDGKARLVVGLWSSAADAGEPRDDLERYALGLGLAEQGDQRAAGYADRLAAGGFVAESGVLRTRAALARHDATAAMAAIDSAIIALRDAPFPFCGVVDQILALVIEVTSLQPDFRRHAVEQLLAMPFATYLAEQARTSIAESLAAASGDAKLCVRAFGAHIDHPRWEEGFLVERLRCMAASGHPRTEQAALDLLEYRNNTAGTFERPAL